MNSAATAPQSWSRPKWILGLLFVFLAHLVFIFAFGSRVQPVPKEAARPFAIRLATTFGDWQELNDPTLFVLPHVHGLGGGMWMKPPKISSPSFYWTGPIRTLEVNNVQFGDGFWQSNRDGVTSSVQVLAIPAPEVAAPDLHISQLLQSRAFSLRVGGGLNRRRIITVPHDGAINSPELLTNTVVQVLVDPNGYVFSPSVLLPGSGSVAADSKAVEMAWSFRFESRTNHPGEWTVGTLIFEWQIVPQSENGGTNVPSRNP